jgi:hypothetical protein
MLVVALEYRFKLGSRPLPLIGQGLLAEQYVIDEHQPDRYRPGSPVCGSDRCDAGFPDNGNSRMIRRSSGFRRGSRPRFLFFLMWCSLIRCHADFCEATMFELKTIRREMLVKANPSRRSPEPVFDGSGCHEVVI